MASRDIPRPPLKKRAVVRAAIARYAFGTNTVEEAIYWQFSLLVSYPDGKDEFGR